MIHQTRQSIRSGQIHVIPPECLLLLTIFGSKKTRRQVDSELGRRAALRPRHIYAMPAARKLQPAA